MIQIFFKKYSTDSAVHSDDSIDSCNPMAIFDLYITEVSVFSCQCFCQFFIVNVLNFDICVSKRFEKW